ncbi:uncharacterized protein LOC125758470 [Rhipicephalus sanguineus]|uniref:uncharacterized protein LOC125758470 n=1 Tax=Rhipicephalus sanguineus TaxID=34632 RepID=UPI0020C1C26A|nr:uncharacterized protein LOC125758470 [Rhipicephalus sanguineus]
MADARGYRHETGYRLRDSMKGRSWPTTVNGKPKWRWRCSLSEKQQKYYRTTKYCTTEASPVPHAAVSSKIKVIALGGTLCMAAWFEFHTENPEANSSKAERGMLKVIRRPKE